MTSAAVVTPVGATEPARPSLRLYTDPCEARNAAVEANLDIVRAAVRPYARHGQLDPDLFQVGAIALTEAIDPADIDCKKLTLIVRYAVRRAHFATVAGVVDLPVKANLLRVAIRRARERLASELGRDATPSEVCRSLQISGVKRSNVAKLMRLMDAGDGWRELASAEGSDGRDEEAIDAEIDALRDILLARLPDRECLALVLWFGFDGVQPIGTFERLGRSLNCTPEAARETLRRAIHRIREHMGAN